MQGGERNALSKKRRDASRLVDRSGPAARPVDHRLTLDPYGLAYSLLRPPASTPKVVAARGWTTGLPPQAIVTKGLKLDRLTACCVPCRLARDGTDGAGKTAREVQGSRLGTRLLQPAAAVITVL